MTRETYVIDGDSHLRDAPTGAAWIAKMWEIDMEGALIWPDEYDNLGRELAHYESETELGSWPRWRLAKLRAFFASHPNPPPATRPDGTELQLPSGKIVVWRNGEVTAK
jgi:hypothetical protein